jgi:hypothetical protein
MSTGRCFEMHSVVAFVGIFLGVGFNTLWTLVCL